MTLSSAWRSFITPPPSLPQEWSYFFVGSTVAYLCGLVLQPIWAIMFFWLDAPIIASICIVTMMMFVAVLVLDQRGWISAAMYLTFLEVTGHAALLTYYVGWEGSFHFFIMDLLAVWCVAPMLRVSIRIVGAIVATLLVVYLHHTYSAAVPFYSIPDAWLTFFMIQSIGTAHVILGVTVYYYAVVNERIYREREELSRELAENRRIEGLGSMAGGVAHQFNNLLAIIMGHAELLGMRSVPQGREKHIDAIRSACTRGQGLSDALLAYSGHREHRRDRQNLAALLHASTKQFIRSYPDCDIRVEAASEEMLVEVDANQVDQAITALLANAREASQELPAIITVSLTRQKVTPALLSRLAKDFGLSQGEEVTCLEVSDHGEGIASGIREKLFEPFYTTRHQVGLGLSQVIGMLRIVGGGIEVESTLGTGSRFTIYLPLAAKAPASTE